MANRRRWGDRPSFNRLALSSLSFSTEREREEREKERSHTPSQTKPSLPEQPRVPGPPAAEELDRVEQVREPHVWRLQFSLLPRRRRGAARAGPLGRDGAGGVGGAAAHIGARVSERKMRRERKEREREKGEKGSSSVFIFLPLPSFRPFDIDLLLRISLLSLSLSHTLSPSTNALFFAHLFSRTIKFELLFLLFATTKKENRIGNWGIKEKTKPSFLPLSPASPTTTATGTATGSSSDLLHPFPPPLALKLLRSGVRSENTLQVRGSEPSPTFSREQGLV